MRVLAKVQSVCPVCLKPIEARYEDDEGAVYFRKECPEHGKFSTIAAESTEDYLNWMKFEVMNVKPNQAMTQGKAGECPLHCGTCDQHLQAACCVLLDVTNRCNQTCPFCFASANEDPATDPKIESIIQWYDELLELGDERPFNIHISGGEPTVRDDLPEIVRAGKERGFEYIQINTNGRRLAQEPDYAKTLKDAGASVAYLQFDGLTDDVFEKLRGEKLLETKLQAIENCKKARLPVVLVPTVVSGVNDGQIGDLMNFMLDNLNVVKGIHFQPVSFFGRYPDTKDRITMFNVMHEIENQTSGAFKYEDLLPISTGHQLCCFCVSYMKEIDGSLTLMTNKDSPQPCCSDADPGAIMKKNRDFVLNKWEVNDTIENPKKPCSCQDMHMSFDDILHYMRSNMFTVSAMPFQDLSNLDAERVKRCRVHQYHDGKLIPFCAYNSIYRES